MNCSYLAAIVLVVGQSFLKMDGKKEWKLTLRVLLLIPFKLKSFYILLNGNSFIKPKIKFLI